jgi:hypothetical protein
MRVFLDFKNTQILTFTVVLIECIISQIKVTNRVNQCAVINVTFCVSGLMFTIISLL